MTMNIDALRLCCVLALVPSCFNPSQPAASSGGSEAGETTDGASSNPSEGPSSAADSSADPDTSTDPSGPDGSATSSAESDADSTAGEQGTTAVRVVHAATGSGSVDVYLAGSAEPVGLGVEYGGASVFVDVDAGPAVFEIRGAGTAPDSSPLFVSDAVVLDADAQINVVVAGVAEDEGGDGLHVVTAPQPNSVAEPGTARIAFVHAGADLPAFDIDVGNDDSAEIQDLARFEASHPAGLEVPAGEAITIGLKDGAERITQFTLPAFADGAQIVVAVAGLVASLPREPDGLTALQVLSDGPLPLLAQDPRVYAIHAFPGVSSTVLDVCEDGQLLIDGLDWTEVGGAARWFQVPAGEHMLTLQDDDEDCAGGVRFGPESTGTLETGEQYLAVAGRDEAGGSQLVTAREQFSLDLSPSAVVWGINVAEAVDWLTLGHLDGGGNVSQTIMELDNGDVVGEGELEGGSHHLALTRAQVAPFVASASGVRQFGNGDRTWLVLAGNGDVVGTGASTALRLRVVETSQHPEPWTLTELVLEAE